MLYVLLIICLISLCMCIVSIIKVRNSKDSFTFIYHWGILYGAFVWEDMLVFGTAAFLIATITILFHDIRIGLLSLSVFWAVRGSGETVYFLLQQFHRPIHAPHEISGHFQPLRFLLGEIDIQKYFIIMQVVMEMIAVGAVVATILLIINWRTLPSW